MQISFHATDCSMNPVGHESCLPLDKEGLGKSPSSMDWLNVYGTDHESSAGCQSPPTLSTWSHQAPAYADKMAGQHWPCNQCCVACTSTHVLKPCATARNCNSHSRTYQCNQAVAAMQFVHTWMCKSSLSKSAASYCQTSSAERPCNKHTGDWHAHLSMLHYRAGQ